MEESRVESQELRARISGGACSDAILLNCERRRRNRYDRIAPDAGSIGTPLVSFASASTTFSRLDGSTASPPNSSLVVERVVGADPLEEHHVEPGVGPQQLLQLIGRRLALELLGQRRALLDHGVARLVADLERRVVVRRLHQERLEHAVFIGFEILERDVPAPNR